MFLLTTLLAQVSNPLLGGDYDVGGWNYLNRVLPSFVDIAFLVGVIIFIFIFVAGAFGWITAGGDKGKLETARKRITHAIVGLLILLLVFFLTQLVNAILGINIGMLGSPGFEGDDSDSTATPTIAILIGNCDGDVDDNLCVCSCPTGYEPINLTQCTLPFPDCTDRDCECVQAVYEGCYPTGAPCNVTEPDNGCCSNYCSPASFTCQDVPPTATPMLTIFPTATPIACIGYNQPCVVTEGGCCSGLYCSSSTLRCQTVLPTATPAASTPTLTGIPFCIPDGSTCGGTDPGVCCSGNCSGGVCAASTGGPLPTYFIVVTPIPTRTPTPSPTRTPTLTPTRTPTPAPIYFCTDSDGGVVPGTFGIVQENVSDPFTIGYLDWCSSSTSVSEAFCSPTLRVLSQNIVCTVETGGTMCSGGECCMPLGGACSDDDDCCSQDICNNNICQNTGNVLLNEPSSLTQPVSCRSLCLLNSFSGCTSIGTDTAGTNGGTAIYRSGSCGVSYEYNCSTAIYDVGISCYGHDAYWTYCRCY